MKRLNLGCGNDYREGWVNHDYLPHVKADVYFDLNKYPYPLKAGQFDGVYASHVIEHLDRPIRALEEIHRVLKPGGILVMKSPHFSRGFTDPTHKSGFSVHFFEYFNPNSKWMPVPYSTKRWWVVSAKVRMRGENPHGTLSLFWRLLDAAANASPHFFDAFWCYWFGGAAELVFEAEKAEGD